MRLKKSDDDKAVRKMAEVTVDLFLEVVYSRESDCGWRGDSLIGKLVAFKGELPQSSGFSGFSKVWEETVGLRDWTKAHKMACIVMMKLSDRQREAACIDRAYRGRVKAIDPFNPDKPVEILWDDRRCADELKCSIPAFRQRIVDAYSRLESMLSLSKKAVA